MEKILYTATEAPRCSCTAINMAPAIMPHIPSQVLMDTCTGDFVEYLDGAKNGALGVRSLLEHLNCS